MTTTLANKPRPVSSPRASLGQRRALGRVLVHLCLLAGVFFMFVPLVWTISTSLKAPGDVYAFPPKWIPDPVRWENYREATTSVPFGRYLWNTTVITLVSIVGKVISVTLVAFAFARL